MSPTKSAHEVSQVLTQTIGRALRGKEEAIELALVALLARGHLLVEDVPGVGKTTLARAIARCVGAEFRRVQCTSDLMPSDVLGAHVYRPSTGAFEWRPGPVFTDILLADEVNRATPRTQSALLEAMEERQVSVEGETRALAETFFVVATQNPDDFHGTFPLPESQLDRFLVRMGLGYPPPEVERAVLAESRSADPVSALPMVVTLDELRAAQEEVLRVRLTPTVVDYLHAIVRETRTSELFELGASTRAALSVAVAARARALVHGRDHVRPDDVKQLAVPCLAHRVRPRNARVGRAGRDEAERAVRLVLDRVPVPV